MSALLAGWTLEEARSWPAVMFGTPAAATTRLASKGDCATSDCVARKRVGSVPSVDGSVTLVIAETMLARLIRTSVVA